jgi:glycerophosphoryl diester phosphodiesterase
MTKLPEAFLSTPIAHRAFHDRSAGRPENSRGAFRAAIAAGYAIECDVQMSKDGKAMVFHDDRLDRLTPETGPLHDRTMAQLKRIPLKGCDETIPTLAEVLQIVAGKVPLLIEIKDQDGALGSRVGRLERAVAKDLQGYEGPVALMSFNPHSVAVLAKAAPDVPRGLTTSSYFAKFWPDLPAGTREHLRAIPDYDRVDASFISHEAGDLARARVAALKAKGARILTWTIRSAKAEAEARKMADNITFEGYAARIP